MVKVEQDEDAYLQHVQPDKDRLIMDVTKWFTRSCDVSAMLRWWHPIEYPMFHLCASLLLAPLLLPGGRWMRQHHANYVLHLSALVVTNNLVQSQVMHYGSFTNELLDFFRICPLMGIDPDHNECKRFAFFGALFSIFGGMQHCYKLILRHHTTYANQGRSCFPHSPAIATRWTISARSITTAPTWISPRSSESLTPFHSP